MEEEKTTQIENPGKITLEELAYMVKQMRHNQREVRTEPNAGKDCNPDGMGTKS